LCDTENVNCFNDDANVNLGCVRLSSGCRHKQQTSARLKKTNIFSNLQVSPDDNLTDITNRFFFVKDSFAVVFVNKHGCCYGQMQGGLSPRVSMALFILY